MVNKLINALVSKKGIWITAFLLITLVCVILQFTVEVNYNTSDYLPEEAESTKALSIMQEEFDDKLQNARAMIKDVTLAEALEYKRQLSEVPGVSEVQWLDDLFDLTIPLELQAHSVVEQYYKDSNAVFSIVIQTGKEEGTVASLYELFGDKIAVSGDAVNIAVAQAMSVDEALNAVLLLIPVILIILLISTDSWLEPLLFLITMGVSVLVNMGTNVIFSDISYVTSSISPILQMAVSLDYAIFLLHNFEALKREGHTPVEAMKASIKRSFPAICACALTTFVGFVALTLMDFELGSNLGLVLAKGIIISLLTVMLLLPSLALLCTGWLDKTTHKRFMPGFKRTGKFVSKIKAPFAIVIIILLIPAFLAQQNNSFSYGMGELDPSSRAGQDYHSIQESFGRSIPIVLLVERGDMQKEAELCEQLGKIPNVSSVTSYVTLAGEEIPEEYISDSIKKNFYSENYTRILISLSTAPEGNEAFEAMMQIRQAAASHYQNSLTCGQTASLYDMMEVITGDSIYVNLAALIGICVILLLTFRSLSLPIILILTIQGSIWINLSVEYFTGSVMCYIGYLVISTVQLGATVDYAILFTDHYMKNRRLYLPDRAKQEAVRETYGSILVSALILGGAGFILQLSSSNDIVSQLGALLGRGALLSLVMVLLFLPSLLGWLDRVVGITTIKARFLPKAKANNALERSSKSHE